MNEETEVVEIPTENETPENPVQETPAQETPAEEISSQETPTEQEIQEQEETQETQSDDQQQTENNVRKGIFPKKIYLTQEECTQKALESLALNRQVAAKKTARAQYVDEFDTRLKQMDAEIKQLEESANNIGNIALNGEMIENIPVEIHRIGNEDVYVREGTDINQPENIVYRQTIEQ